MSVRVREFIGLLQNNVELINEIAKLESHTISRKNVLNLMNQLYSPNTLEILENLVLFNEDHVQIGTPCSNQCSI